MFWRSKKKKDDDLITDASLPTTYSSEYDHQEVSSQSHGISQDSHHVSSVSSSRRTNAATVASSSPSSQAKSIRLSSSASPSFQSNSYVRNGYKPSRQFTSNYSASCSSFLMGGTNYNTKRTLRIRR